jgi:ribonuclease HIII
MIRSFALLSTIVLVVIFSYLSINIIQNKSYNNQINKEKYLEIQGQIHLKQIIKNINHNPNIQDDRFVFDKYEDNNSYHIYIKSKDILDAHISLYQKIDK